MTAPLDLKKTVNLPNTPFPMKANLPIAEPKMLAQWNQDGLYPKIRAARAGRPMYVLHDGPPYANGDIHLGHAFNKILGITAPYRTATVRERPVKDFGYDSPYIPGWDCHGLPIEIKVDGELGSKKANMTVAQIRDACRKYAQKYVDLQSRDFQRLGVFGPYLTVGAEYDQTSGGR